jgi:hypothetical protein
MGLVHDWLVPCLWAAWLLAWIVPGSLERWTARVVHFTIFGCAVALIVVPRLGDGPLGAR